jgi:hypothetical protein
MRSKLPPLETEGAFGSKNRRFFECFVRTIDHPADLTERADVFQTSKYSRFFLAHIALFTSMVAMRFSDIGCI